MSSKSDKNDSEEETWKDYQISCSEWGSYWLRVLSFLAINALYVTVGAFSFSSLEREYESLLCAEAEDVFRDFTSNLTQIRNDTFEVTTDELLLLVREVERFSQDGISVGDYQTRGCPDLWTFTGALYFCFAIGTSVGYGDIAPKTFNGRLVFIFYVVPAICVCGALIAEIGRVIYRALNRGSSIVALYTKRVWVYWVTISLFLLGFFILVPAGVICAFMNWSFFDALYFSMVTFTTVGFGDLTITESDYKFIIILFSYFGLAWIGVVAGVVTEQIQKTNKIRAHTVHDKTDDTIKSSPSSGKRSALRDENIKAILTKIANMTSTNDAILNELAIIKSNIMTESDF